VTSYCPVFVLFEMHERMLLVPQQIRVCDVRILDAFHGVLSSSPIFFSDCIYVCVSANKSLRSQKTSKEVFFTEVTQPLL